MVIFVLAVMVVTVAACKSHVLSDSFEKELDARTRQLQQELHLRMEEGERRRQVLLDAKEEFDARRINLTQEAEVQQLVQSGSGSTKDLRALIKGLKRRDDAALDKFEGEKMQNGFLDSRGWHAKVELPWSRQELVTMDRATVHTAHRWSAKAVTSLEDRLHGLQVKVDLETQQALSRHMGWVIEAEAPTMEHELVEEPIVDEPPVGDGPVDDPPMGDPTGEDEPLQDPQVDDPPVEAGPVDDQVEDNLVGDAACEGVAASPQRKPFMWLVYLYIPPSIAVTALKVYGRFGVSQRR